MEYLISLISDPVAWTALATLIILEIVLGIDNLIFIAVISNKLPEGQRDKARKIGIGLALIIRLALLSLISVIVTLTDPIIEVFGKGFSWRDIILILGGFFLVWKATKEIHHKISPEDGEGSIGTNVIEKNFTLAVSQIILLDFVFSIDSIITAVGMTQHIPIMFIAVIFAVGVMFFAANPISRFIESNPTIVMLALGFLLLIGTTLIAEGFGVHMPKGYIYTAMAFAALVEALNILSRKSKDRKKRQRI
ncbi:MAG: TerC family protein [Terasakiella sp.]|uniref:TerC family protein n=1 Tax=unclassified Terasakiella TaxID=2614952 RepID=UPI003B00827B